MQEKYIFNTTIVNEEEFNEYINRGFITEDKFTIQKLFYKLIFVFLFIFFGTSLILFYKFRKSYIIRQRGFNLSFFGGIAAYLDITFSLMPQIMKVPCALSVYQANFINVLVNLIFFCRSLRVLLYYHYNVYKVTSVKKSRVNEIIEPNIYFAKFPNKINLILKLVICIPSSISLIVTLIIHLTVSRDNCSFTEFKDAMIELKQNKGRELFYIVQTFGTFYTFLSFIMTILLSRIKENNIFGIKSECLSTCIIIFIANIVNIILQVNSSKNYEIKTDKHRRVYLDLFEITKGGKLLFTTVSIYILFTSITLPIIHYFKAKIENKRFIKEDLTSREFFNKVLNNSLLVNELRNIAIDEFSVENVLFWENYQVLKNMNYRYIQQYKKAEELGDFKIINQYNFDLYYQDQIDSFSKSSIDSYFLDPNALVPEKLLPYYIKFYKTFINYYGPAPVNIHGETIRDISNEISFPTIGIFDKAKDEVTDLMYSSIYPILLSKHEKYIKETIS